MRLLRTPIYLALLLSFFTSLDANAVLSKTPQTDRLKPCPMSPHDCSMPSCPESPWQTVTVQGIGELKVFPDTFSLSASIETEDASLEKTRLENTQKMTALRNGLKSLNLKNPQLQTTSFNLYPVYKTNKCERLPKLLGYHLSNRLSIKVTGLSSEQLADMASRVLAIASEHASETGSLSFYLEDMRSAQVKALALAAKNAQAQAEALAQGAGATLGPIQKMTTVNDHL